MAGLRDVLERHREALSDLPGVVGTATGLERAGHDEAIHVYVRSPQDVEPVRRAAEALLKDTPLEVIVMGIPEAQ